MRAPLPTLPKTHRPSRSSCASHQTTKLIVPRLTMISFKHILPVKLQAATASRNPIAGDTAVFAVPPSVAEVIRRSCRDDQADATAPEDASALLQSLAEYARPETARVLNNDNGWTAGFLIEQSVTANNRTEDLRKAWND